MKYIYVLVLTICLSFNSCVSQNQLEIELVNKKIYFIELNSENEQYKNDKERELSYNLIKVNLRNVSGKKILLFINPNEFGFYSEGFSRKTLNM